VIVHLEESDEGVPMTELAGRILASKSGFTRVIDKMVEAGGSSAGSARRTTADSCWC
jgi:hypothetical protein